MNYICSLPMSFTWEMMLRKGCETGGQLFVRQMQQLLPSWMHSKRVARGFGQIYHWFHVGNIKTLYRMLICDNVALLHSAIISSASSCCVSRRISRGFNLAWRQIHIQQPSVIPFQSIGSFYREIFRQLLTGFQIEHADTGSSRLAKTGPEI